MIFRITLFPTGVHCVLARSISASAAPTAAGGDAEVPAMSPADDTQQPDVGKGDGAVTYEGTVTCVSAPSPDDPGWVGCGR